jgi:hypothetical protein
LFGENEPAEKPTILPMVRPAYIAVRDLLLARYGPKE